ncbi:MAG TPA: SDR family NAD(P)-dependent oxidoreductase, partial [Acidimicrobiales bacterium]
MGSRFDLTGKVAIVTGSTKGLGRAMAQGLAEAGASVVVSSRKQDLCDKVAAEIAESTGRETLGIACHVGDWDA